MKNLYQTLAKTFGNVDNATYVATKTEHEGNRWDNNKNLSLAILRGSLPDKPASFQPTVNEKLNAMVRNLDPRMIYGHPQAGYINADGTHRGWEIKFGDIHMPHAESFYRPVDYVHTVCHELSHYARGALEGPMVHKGKSFSEKKTMLVWEEVIAELTNAIVLGEIDPGNEDHVALSGEYLHHFIINGVEHHVPGMHSNRQVFDKVLPEAIRRAEYMLKAVEGPVEDAHKTHKPEEAVATDDDLWDVFRRIGERIKETTRA